VAAAPLVVVTGREEDGEATDPDWSIAPTAVEYRAGCQEADDMKRWLLGAAVVAIPVIVFLAAIAPTAVE
jgi:hypothetical protein